MHRTVITPEAATHTFEKWYEIYAPKYRRASGIRQHLSTMYGKGQWGEDEFVRYMMELYEYDRDALVKEPPKEMPIPTGPAQDRFQAYMEYYEDPAPNDVLLLRQMARIEAQLDTIQDRWEEAIAEGNRTASAAWAKMVKDLTSEHRNIQATLGISRSARDKTKSREDLADYVQDIIRKTASFMDEHAIQIQCPHCALSPAQTEIDMGFILFHFRQDVPWHFEFQCPLCQESVRLP